MTSVRNSLRRLWHRMLTSHYLRGCQVGQGTVIKGLARVRRAGKIVIGENCIIDSSWARPVRIDVGPGAELRIGDGAYLNEGISITCNVGVEIGAGCLLAPDAILSDDDGHPVDWQMRAGHWPKGPEDRYGAPIRLEANVWLCSRSVILKGVTVGAGTVVASGAVVTKTLPPGVVAAGVPAKVIRQIQPVAAGR